LETRVADFLKNLGFKYQKISQTALFYQKCVKTQKKADVLTH